jgi:hypothetical protein
MVGSLNRLLKYVPQTSSERNVNDEARNRTTLRAKRCAERTAKHERNFRLQTAIGLLNETDIQVDVGLP